MMRQVQVLKKRLSMQIAIRLRRKGKERRLKVVGKYRNLERVKSPLRVIQRENKKDSRRKQTKGGK